jgi:hypothetical protein
MFDRDVASAIVPAAWLRIVIDLILTALSSVERAPSNLPPLTTDRAQEQFRSFEVRDVPTSELDELFQRMFRRLDPRVRSIVRSALAENQEELERKYLEIAGLPDEIGFDLGVPRMVILA